MSKIIWVKKMLKSEKFWAQKNLVQKSRAKKIKVLKNWFPIFWVQNNLGSDKFLGSKRFGLNKILDQKFGQIGSVTAEILLMWKNVARTNISRTNVSMKAGVCQ